MDHRADRGVIGRVRVNLLMRKGRGKCVCSVYRNGGAQPNATTGLAMADAGQPHPAEIGVVIALR
jgi:hypothetical protein